MNGNAEVVRVPVNIKTGSLGRGGVRYEPVAALHDQTRNLEVDMTWAQAIWKEFNLVLDPQRYYFRRFDPSTPLHSLDTQISELLVEHKREPRDGNWKVTIIDIQINPILHRNALVSPPDNSHPRPQQQQQQQQIVVDHDSDQDDDISNQEEEEEDQSQDLNEEEEEDLTRPRVMVNIKTGSLGRGGKAYESMAVLHDKTRNLDVDMTWAEALWKEFKLVLDGQRYVMRHCLSKPQPPSHSLDSPISELLAEFTEEPLDGIWRVTVIDLQSKNVLLSNQMRQEKAMERGESVRSRPKKRKVEAQPQQVSTPRHLPTATTSRSSGTTNYRPPQMVVNDDDESESEISNQDEEDDQSQDSNEEADDLMRLGIREEDFKSIFLQRIQKNLTAEMLVKAQAALIKQKATSSETSSSRDQWTKWSLTCPYAVSVLRSLFDV